MELSVIIVNYRGWSKLRECLSSLLKDDGPGAGIEIIVSDNCSADGNLAGFSAEFPSVKFVENIHNGGFAYGCNRGAAAASGSYFLFLNPDTIASKDSVHQLLEKGSSAAANSLSSCYQVDGKGKESIAYGRFITPFTLTGTMRLITRLSGAQGTMKYTGDIMKPDWVSGSVMFIRRVYFYELGGFDEDFWMYFEDMDLCKRIRNSGGEILYHRGISIIHSHGGSSRVNIKTTALTKTEVLVSKHLYVAKHFSGAGRFVSQFFLVVNNLLCYLVAAVVGLILFFIPSLNARSRIFVNLVAYYAGSLARGTWKSRRSVSASPGIS